MKLQYFTSQPDTVIPFAFVLILQYEMTLDSPELVIPIPDSPSQYSDPPNPVMLSRSVLVTRKLFPVA